MTPRAVRVEDELWNAAIAKAAANKDNLSAIIRDALRTYIEKNEGQMNISDVAIGAAINEVIAALPGNHAEIAQRKEMGGLSFIAISGTFNLDAIVQAALEAAAPHLMADAWDEGCEEGFARGDDPSGRLEGWQPNPYRHAVAG